MEEDIYEFEMRIKNVEEEDDALLLMRQINTRIAVLDDYIYTNPEEDNSHWLKVMDRYQQLREQLAKKTTYSRKNYGIWTDYNTLGVGDMYR